MTNKLIPSSRDSLILTLDLKSSADLSIIVCVGNEYFFSAARHNRKNEFSCVLTLLPIIQRFIRLLANNSNFELLNKTQFQNKIMTTM